MSARPTPIASTPTGQSGDFTPRSLSTRLSSSLAGTPPSGPPIPNIPPRNAAGSPALAASVPRPQGSFSSRSPDVAASLSNNTLLAKKEVVKPGSQGQSNLAATLSASPSGIASPPNSSSLHQRHSNPALRPPSTSGQRSGSSTPLNNDSAFSNLAEIPDEEKARILRKHLVSAQERQAGHNSQGGTPDPGAPSPADDLDPSRNGSAVGEGSSVGNDNKADDSDQFPIPYDVVGGDVTHDLYKFAQANAPPARPRAASFSHVPTVQVDPAFQHIKEPGGFRRAFVMTKAQEQGLTGPPVLRNVVDFLFLYGHFAGEDLFDDADDDDEDDDEDGPPTRSYGTREDNARSLEAGERPTLGGERAPLLGSRAGSKTRHKRSKSYSNKKKGSSVTQAVLMLLKGFVGTGILFLGKAFYNGGMLFSSVTLIALALISLWSFLLLVKTNAVVDGSFGDMGGHLYGKYMRFTILASIVLSQIGFVCAYTIFIAENLRAWVAAVTNCGTILPIAAAIAIQLVLFLPLATVRNLAHLSGAVILADILIVLGIIYIVGSETAIIASQGIADVKAFNPADFSLMIGTAVFAWEGIGLVLPIVNSMERPEKFPVALSGVMAGLSILFTGVGALSYATFGSEIQTVVLVNLDLENKGVQTVQFLYTLAILLSAPLQFFPITGVLENALFVRSGKFNTKVKWQKNVFRAGLVLFCSIVSWLGSGDLDKFVSFVGCFCCVPLCFIYPPMLHLKGRATNWHEKAIDITMISFGVIVACYTSVQTIVSLFSESAGEAPKVGLCDKHGH